MSRLDRIAAASALAAWLLAASTAQAGFDVCNETKDDVTVAFGYREDGEWTSSGWWNIAPQRCATVYDKNLKERYYYYYAEQVNGGVYWQGESDSDVFCATDEVFTIVGDADCAGRGFDSYRFRRIDVGDRANSYVDLRE